MSGESVILGKMRKTVERGTVRHRCCDVCGCELAMPDVGLFSRETLNTAVCTDCSNTEEHCKFLEYVERLRESYSKKEILRMLDERLNGVCGTDASVFTIEEWNEQMSEKESPLERLCAS